MGKIIWLKDIGKNDVSIVGGKGANLGELTTLRFLVPEGFVISTDVYKAILDEAQLFSKIQEYLLGLNVEDTRALQEVSDKIQSLITSISLPQSVVKEIVGAYKQLGSGLVAVRSSATAEDLKSASFAGQQETYLNVEGEEVLLDAIKKCMASLFTARAIYYRVQNKFEHSKVLIAVIVQRMVQAQKAGVIFSVNPVSNNEGEVIIEAAVGLGEAVVGGEIRPDNYVVSKADNKVKERHLIGEQPLLDDSQIEELAEMAKIVEAHYKFPQDIEWAIDGSGAIYVLQTRPITTFQKIEKKPQWKKILSREYGVQYTEMSLRCLSPENKDVVPEPFYEQVYVPEDSNEVCYIEEDRWTTFTSALQEKYLEHPENYEEFESLFLETGSEYVKIAKQISQQNLQEKSNQALKELYITYQKQSLRYAPFIWMQFIINNFYADKTKEILTAKLGEGEKLYDAYEVALKPYQKAAVLQLSERALHWKKLSDAEKYQAYEDFKWMPCLDIHNRPWIKEEFFSRIDEFQQQEKKTPLTYEQLLEQINVTPEEKQVLDNTKRLAYLKDLKDDFRRQGVFYGQTLFEEFAKRMKVKLEDVSYMLEAEILEFLNDKKVVSQDIIRERQNGFVSLFAENKVLKCVSGNEIEDTLHKLGIAVAVATSGEVKGVPASPGQAKGPVVIVRGVADLSRVKKGDVLVAVVTHPDYVPVMQRAVAIVTDEGGITSHAAIVSRELKIPCIVGTENATKLLKDGDVVEVDATFGFVKKLTQ